MSSILTISLFSQTVNNGAIISQHIWISQNNTKPFVSFKSALFRPEVNEME